MVARGMGLRARFIVACGVLVLTSVLAGIWTLISISK